MTAATTEHAHDALHRARTGQSTANYQAIFEGFAAKGIPLDQIDPRENVLTFWAWKAIGRRVRKGEHGVKVFTWVNAAKDVTRNGTTTREDYRFCRTSTVFHVSQTEADPQAEAIAS